MVRASVEGVLEVLDQVTRRSTAPTAVAVALALKVIVNGIEPLPPD